MRIGFLGDVHGKLDAFHKILMNLVQNHNIKMVIQVGDFSLCKKNMKHPSLLNLPVPLFLIDGNHDDFRYLNNTFKQEEAEKWKNYDLHYQSRGSVFDVENTVIGCIGGALNVHCPQNCKNGNVITDDDVNKAIQSFNMTPPDIIVSHSCPAGIGIGMKGNLSHAIGIHDYILRRGYDVGPSNDIGEAQLTRLWDCIEHKPKLWIFGHFHKYHSCKIQNTQFVCLPFIESELHQSLVWDSDTEVHYFV